MWIWLKAHLSNRWMNDENFLAAMAHSGWAMAIVFIAYLLGHMHVAHIASVLLGLFAFFKEFGYDAFFEIPRQTFLANLSDFLEYLAGIGLAWAVLALAH